MMTHRSQRLEYQPVSPGEWEAEAEGGIVFEVKSLYAYLNQLHDQRDPRGVRYRLAEALTLILLAKLGGEDEPRGMAAWLKYRARGLARALGLKRQTMPHRTTISRILGQAVAVAELEELLPAFFDDQVQTGAEVVIALDGKTLRGTIPTGQSQGLHLLAAYVPKEGVVLMQVEVESKENEIVAAPRVLKCLDLRGKVVVGDALHTQRKLSIQIIQAHGHYLWTAKGNQPDLYEAIAHLFEPELLTPGFGPTPTDFETASTFDKAHGRFEYRTITTSAMLKDYLDWPYVEQVFKLERRFVNLTTGEVKQQVSYGLTSLPRKQASPHDLLHYRRTYWGIENGLHYRRDVTLKEDRCRLRLGNAARVIAILNNLTIGLVLRQGFRYLPDARRKFSALPLEALQLITLAFDPTLL